MDMAFEAEVESQIFDSENLKMDLLLNQTAHNPMFMKNTNPVKNPYLEKLEMHASSLMENIGEIEAWAPSLLDLPELIQNMIFNFVWSNHGRIEGIHPDFGRMAYINSEEINPCYWVNNEQRLEMILNLTEGIRRGDEYLIK